MAQRSSRRGFMKTGTLAGAGFWVATRADAAAQGKSANEQLCSAGIGVGGKGSGDVEDLVNLGCNCVGLCDVDKGAIDFMMGWLQRWAIDHEKPFRKPAVFADYREMLGKIGKQIDVVTVSTPDHMHAVATMMAMKMGKHVYTQKPLCHDVYEARMLTKVAKETGVVTQMGNQGSAEDGLRTAVEIVQSGALGAIKEVHAWTNRPTWPQGIGALMQIKAVTGMKLVTDPPAWPHGTSGDGKEVAIKLFKKNKPAAAPSNLAWNLWLGTAPYRPYDPIYAPFGWRAWWDYGTGALGDMACHTANMPFRACSLGYPTSVEAEMSEYNDQTYPMWSVIRYEFPARTQTVPGRGTVELPPLKWTWYDGGADKPAWVIKKLKELACLGEKDNLAFSGSLIIGEKGRLFSPNDNGAEFKLLPEASFAGYKPSTPWIPRVHKAHQKEFVDAVKAGKPENCFSRFEVAGPLTETVVLGCVAMRAGRKIEWDGPNMKITNMAEANKFLRRQYRKGYEL